MKSIRAASVDEVPAGTLKSFNIEGTVVLVVNLNGHYYAIGNRCTHMGGDLSKGQLEGKIVKCPRHGSQFDVTTGKNMRGPKIIVQFSTRDEPVYEVKVEGNSIQVQV